MYIPINDNFIKASDLFMLIAAAVICLILAMYFILTAPKNPEAKIEKVLRVRSGKVVSAAYFKQAWSMQRPSWRNPGIGLKYDDVPGCYIILMRNERTDERECTGAFVGHSENIYASVKKQLSGRGDIAVRSALLSGDTPYVQCFECHSLDRATLLHDLAEHYNATVVGEGKANPFCEKTKKSIL